MDWRRVSREDAFAEIDRSPVIVVYSNMGVGHAACEFDSVERAFFAFFRDGNHGKTCACVEADLDPREDADAFTVRPLDIILGEDVREVHFRRDKRRRLHALIATAGGRLYYKCATKALMRVAEGQANWHPRVSSAGRTHVGFYRENVGFRFREVNQGRGRRLKEAV